jgi:CubicO group peptidase (beta-lactamase class C family)
VDLLQSTQGTDVLPSAVARIEEGRQAGLHLGAQLYVSLEGTAMVNLATGEADLGVPMATDTLMPWLSATKAVTSVAAVQQWARGAFDLDDPVARHIPEFGSKGKDCIRIRHLFTHTAGIRGADSLAMDFTDKTPEQLWGEALQRVCETDLEAGWVPGQRAGYHLGSGMMLLAELVQRASGKPFSTYVREEIFELLGMADCWVGLPVERFRAYGSRMGVMHVTAGAEPQPFPLMATAEQAPIVIPSGGGRGPMSQLARLYETLLGRGRRDGVELLSPVAVEAMTARHRVGLLDETYGIVVDWGLGFMIDAISYGRHCSPRTFGHGGMQSSVAFCDPEHGLVVAMVFNGMPGHEPHYRRLEAVSTAIYEDLGLVDRHSAGRDHPCPAPSLA